MCLVRKEVYIFGKLRIFRDRKREREKGRKGEK